MGINSDRDASMKEALQRKATGSSAVPTELPGGLSALLSAPSVKGRFEEVLGKRAPAFLSSILSVTNGNPLLRNADPMSIVAAAAVAASLDLPVNPNLGFAALVPYKDKGRPVAQFQMMVRGYVQLAIRTAFYQTMNVSPVYEGELASYNRITGDVRFDAEGKQSEAIVGYAAYFRLLNGFEKYLYMDVDAIRAHGKRYSKSYDNPQGKWKTDFEAMAAKTVLKQLLARWGILSIQMQTALMADQAVLRELPSSGEAGYEYPDNPESELFDITARPTDDATEGEMASAPESDKVQASFVEGQL